MEGSLERKDERRHLEDVVQVVREKLDLARGDSQAQQAELINTRNEVHQEAERTFHNLWSAEDFEELAVLSEFMQPLAHQETRHGATLKRVALLERMSDAPYFARIDLRYEGDAQSEPVYIGRSTLWNEKANALLVHDWRSPVASVFYRFGLEQASYEAPVGRICCEVTRKRQYEIKGGVLLYYFDAETVIQDAFLRQMLSQNASPKMKAIVETIQRDQDMAIRDETHELLMVQGVAGSGKTSIALHRVAYLMYEGLKSRLEEHNILILSPNTLFEQYIDGVLPELGERSVTSKTLEDLLEALLGAQVQSRADRLDALCAASPRERARMREALEFKGSPEFRLLLDRFLAEIPRRSIRYEDLCYAGKTMINRQEIQDRVLKRDSVLPLGAWLRRFEESIWRRVRELRPARMEILRRRARANNHGEDWARAYAIRESAILARQLRAMTRLDCHALYSRLISDEGTVRRLAKGAALPENLAEILGAPLRTDQDHALRLEDACAIAYLKLRLYASPMRGEIKQVVVDEAQDYGSMDFSVLRLLFPRARFTVLGDVNQAMEHAADLSLYERVRAALACRSAAMMELTKSFRCTREILDFSRQFLKEGRIESFNRQGEAPRVLPEEQIAREVAFCREQGDRSIALIAKTMKEAKRWARRLDPALRVGLMGRAARPGDAFVIPLALSKGLEFDAALILDCDAAHYGEAEDARMLYVACTRALHRLRLFYQGEPSPLIGRREEEHGEGV